MLSHACYSINTWIQVRVRFIKKKTTRKQEMCITLRTYVCGSVCKRRENERVRERARVHERKGGERVIERLRLTCLLVKRCRLPHQCLMPVLPGAGNLVQKGEKREEGESREKKAG